MYDQGDEYDSSDEEWKAYGGENAHAFLGLEEPIQEIPLDGGLRIDWMVRNAFERADEIHCTAMEGADNSSGNSDREVQFPNAAESSTRLKQCICLWSPQRKSRKRKPMIYTRM